MSEYKNLLSIWLNVSKDGKGAYYAIKNDSDQPITIQPGKSIYANINTRRPVASKSIKLDNNQSHQDDGEDIASDIPF